MKSPAFIPRILVVLASACCAASALGQPNTWTYRAHMQLQRTQFGAATGADGRIYAICGNTSAGGGIPGGTNTAEAYDPATNTWTYVSPNPYLFHEVFAVTGPDGKIYVTNGFLLTVYDTTNDSWTELSAPLHTGHPNGLVVGNDGQLYMITGTSDTSIAHASDEVYNIGTGIWSDPVSPAPFDLPAGGAATTGTNGVVYWTGGEASGSIVPWITTYDAISGAWSSGPYMNDVRGAQCSAPGGDNRIYAISGLDASFRVQTSAEAFDASTGTWSYIPNIQTGRANACAVMGPDGKVYVLGGDTRSAALDSVECFQPQMMSGSAANINAQEGVQFNGAVGSISDANKALVASDFTATIDWGDGSQSAGVISGSAGSFSVSGTHTFAETGTYPTTVSIANSDGENALPAGQAKVADALLTSAGNNFSASVNLAFSGKVASFTDANTSPKLADFSASVSWGDGASSTGTIIANGTGGYDVKGSHTYTSTGSFTVSYSVNDVDGATATGTATATVTEPAPSVAAVTFNATEGGTFNGQLGSLTDADPSLIASDFAATITWGDGTTSSGSVTSNGLGGFNVAGNHKYAEEGTYSVTVSVTAKGSAPGVGNGTAFVADAPIAATGYNLTCKGTIFSDTVATFTDADPFGVAGDYTAGIVWGDGKSSNGTVVKFGSGWKVTGAHSYLKRGRYTVTVHIKDEGGSTANATTNINVGPVK
jgi:hypothetical protein